MPEVDIEYLGIYFKDLVRHRRTYYDDDGKPHEKNRQRPIPEELMGDLEQYIGDGLGRVTVSAELGSSVAFGNKASAFVSISVTCNNNLGDCEQVHDIVQPYVKRLVEEDHKVMSDERDSYIAPDARLKLPEPGNQVAKPPTKKAAAKTNRPPPPGAGKTKAKAKPNFRR